MSAINSFIPSSPMSGVMGLVGGLRANKATDRAANHQASGMSAAQAELKPYMETGSQANTMLSNKLSDGSLGGNFTPGDLTQEPGYQLRLSQGEQALGRKQSAGGNYYSGQALKEAQTYGQGLADQTYNDAYNRWLQQQQNTYNMLSGQQSQGLGAATDHGKYSAGIGDVMANATIAKENQRMRMMSDVYSGIGGK